MPNHVTNILTIEELDQAQEIFKAIQDDKEGLGSIDFNKLIPMPESLNLTCGTIEREAISLYLTAMNPAAPCIGFNKMGQNQYADLSEKLSAAQKFRNYDGDLLAEQVNKMVSAYSKSPEYKDKSVHEIQAELIEMGKTYVNNILEYGASTWYDWRVAQWHTKWGAFDFDSYDGGDSIRFHTAWSPPDPVIQKLSEMYPDTIIKHQWSDEDLGYNVGETIYLGGKAQSICMPIGGSKEAYEMAADIHCLDLEEEGYRYDESEDTYIYDDELFMKMNGGM